MVVLKISVNVPENDAEKVRIALGEAGAGQIGEKYEFCSFSTKGIGRFKPKEGANPAIGSVGSFESVNEEKIETWCSEKDLEKVINAIKSSHPYEEPAIQVSKEDIY